MKVICEKNAEGSSEEIGDPIIKVISRTTWGESLVVFIDGTKDTEKGDRKKVSSEYRGLDIIF